MCLLNISTITRKKPVPKSRADIIKYTIKRVKQGYSSYHIANELNMVQCTLTQIMRENGYPISKIISGEIA